MRTSLLLTALSILLLAESRSPRPARNRVRRSLDQSAEVNPPTPYLDLLLDATHEVRAVPGHEASGSYRKCPRMGVKGWASYSGWVVLGDDVSCRVLADDAIYFGGIFSIIREWHREP